MVVVQVVIINRVSAAATGGAATGAGAAGGAGGGSGAGATDTAGEDGGGVGSQDDDKFKMTIGSLNLFGVGCHVEARVVSTTRLPPPLFQRNLSD